MKFHGMTTFTSVLIITSVVVMMGLGITMKRIDESNLVYHQQKTAKTLAGSEACLEESLIKLQNNHSYSGETLNIFGTTCQVIITGSGNTRTITVNATLESLYNEKLEAMVDWNGPFRITSWKEIS